MIPKNKCYHDEGERESRLQMKLLWFGWPLSGHLQLLPTQRPYIRLYFSYTLYLFTWMVMSELWSPMTPTTGLGGPTIWSNNSGRPDPTAHASNNWSRFSWRILVTKPWAHTRRKIKNVFPFTAYMCLVCLTFKEQIRMQIESRLTFFNGACCRWQEDDKRANMEIQKSRERKKNWWLLYGCRWEGW